MIGSWCFSIISTLIPSLHSLTTGVGSFYAKPQANNLAAMISSLSCVCAHPSDLLLSDLCSMMPIIQMYYQIPTLHDGLPLYPDSTYMYTFLCAQHDLSDIRG
ncbi:hypothetical protein GGR57DRAFT_116630 [Xylariaceae sp. FL1272]|nr:hypothetical protein GGR57DRAFT_116630 [Xylariaceae sp. FL1272]